MKAVTFYVMGAKEDGAAGNYWTTLDTFPVPKTTSYFLGQNGTLTTTAPSASSQTYVYDPNSPTPTVGGNNLMIPCGPKDQRTVEGRNDVLVFTSDVLDSPVAITGAIDAYLSVSSTAVDTDFVVRLTDVYPDGRSILIQDGIRRMRWRDGGIDAKLMTPGTVYDTSMSLWNSSFVFNKGHRIRVSVASANAPRFSANTNTGKALIDDDGSTKIVASNTIHFGPNTRIDLPVVSLEQLPEHDILAIERAWAEARGVSADALHERLQTFIKTMPSIPN